MQDVGELGGSSAGEHDDRRVVHRGGREGSWVEEEAVVLEEAEAWCVCG